MQQLKKVLALCCLCTCVVTLADGGFLPPVDYSGKDLVVSLTEESRVDPERVLGLVQSDPATYRLTPDHRLLWHCGALEGQEVLTAAGELLKRLN